MSSFTSSSSSSEINHKFESTSTATNRYDVYLSFCDQDTSCFALGIYNGLTSESGIVVFWEDKRIRTGDEEIPSSVLNVIEDCKLVVILFSTNYFTSRSCLEELEKITECCRTSDSLIVLTFFYDGGVHLWYGISERAMFGGEAFHDFLDRISAEEISQQGDKFMSWVATISNNKPTTDIDFIYRNKSQHIEEVVEHATNVISKKRFDAFYKESLNSRVQDVIQLLKQSKCPLILGIWGMPGIGKTAIAQAIYHQIGPYFEDTCFLWNVKRSVQLKNNALVSLQEDFLCEINKTTEINISTIESGKVILKERLRGKTVLLVLDDVHNWEQLNALCGSHEWFGEGSKIIITTTDRQLLKEHVVDHIYKVKELDENESLELFNWEVFHQATSQQGFAELSSQVVAYSEGLPIVLKIVGSLLYGKTVDACKSQLHKLKMFPQQDVQGILQAGTFNDLNDEEKQIFLDIAYFFVGMNQNDVLQTLNWSTQPTTHQISLLEDKSLLTIDDNNKLQMHVLLQSMAKEIIRSESRNETDQPKMYDVFLSFRGEDSRAKFISHLHSSLQNAGIHTFKDDDEIQRGDQISTSLLQAIGQSRISIVVLSTNYANSRWCMVELEKIMKIGRTEGLVVVPVFYEVDPSEVRHQKGQFGEKFDDLLSKISVDKSTKLNWKRDLTDIGGTAGFVLINSRNENADIKNIVEHVTRLLDRTELFVAEHPVGVEPRVEAAIEWLNIQKSEDVLILGIWGMGGTGKTTIAKAIYNKVGTKFEGRSFLLDIREFWEIRTSQVSLQQQVLSDVYKTMTFKIRDIDSGKYILKERLSQKRVLVVLDDVNDVDQIKALCGSHKWFGPGSRIIITTRDMDLLRQCGVDQVYTIEEMDESESLELFSWHAFKQPSPTKDYATHAADVIAYSGKLPLALEVLGSYLSNCEIKEWQDALDKLKRIPHDDVQKKLKVSFDGLKDVTMEQIFLDIACFLIGMDRNDAIRILNGCEFFADVGIKVLVERSLVTVDSRNKLQMHDLLRDMGRQVIYEESPLDPEKRSRLWRDKDVIDVLAKRKGTEAVKGLALEFPRKDCLETKSFKKMNKLRLLRLAGVKLKGDFKYLSGDLRWLYWHGFPETYIPAEFQQESLVAVELQYSKLKQIIWNKSQMLENLKILNLSHSLDLTETPDFTYLPNLEKLVLKNCPNLSKVSRTIGYLSKLLLIDLTDCTGLQKLPRSMYKLKSLETLILSGCSNIDKLEEDLEQMESLITLIADKTGIRKLPFSIVRLKNIGYISFDGLEGFSRDVFPFLVRSWMSPSNNVISLVQSSATKLSLGTLKDLLKHGSLFVECGSYLQLTQDVSRILDVLKATSCQKLEASASASTSQISNMYVSPIIDDCLSQVCSSGSNNYLKSLLIQMGSTHRFKLVEEKILQTADGTWDLFLHPCDNNSKWSTFSCKGCSIIFDLPAMKGHSLNSMMLFAVYYSSPNNKTSEDFQGVLIINYTKTTIHAYKRDTLTSFNEEDWQSITSNLEPGNKVGVMVVFGEGFIVEKTTTSLLYDEPVDKEIESCDAVAGEIPAAEAKGDQEQQIPPLEGQPEQQAAAAPEAIGSALGTQILDALRELRADFFRLEQTVTSKWNAVEVRLEVLEDAMAQIPRGSNSESTDV